jgi:2-polyprenyl-6-methoxyphenol hydroxylase-like FAD-dependent oxidoreductase
MTSDSNEILIVGSGFAGLIAGIMLKSANFQVKIFESNSRSQDLGDRITLFPNAMKVLRLVGVADHVINDGYVIEVGKIQDSLGKHMVNRSMGKKSIYGEPTITCRRVKVHEILYDKAIELGIDISNDKKVVGIKEDENGVQLQFENGSNYIGSLLIGCDGINSFVRKSILNKNFQPRYSGLMYFGGFVENQELIKKLDLNPKTHYISIGPTNFFSYCFVDNPETHEFPTLMWNCYLRQQKRLSSEELKNLKLADLIDRVYQAHKGWHSPVEELILNAVKVSKGSISDVVEIDNWYKERIIVIGDAAHAMNPFFGGQGAGTAMEDAYMLAKLIERYNGDYKLAFPTLEKVRKARTTLIASRARKNCEKSTVQYNKLLLKLRNKAFSILTFLTPEHKLNQFISYDVEKELSKVKSYSESK